MKKIVRKSHEKEIAYKLSKKSYSDKTGRGAISAPSPGPDRVNLGAYVSDLYETRNVIYQTLLKRIKKEETNNLVMRSYLLSLPRSEIVVHHVDGLALRNHIIFKSDILIPDWVSNLISQ